MSLEVYVLTKRRKQKKKRVEKDIRINMNLSESHLPLMIGSTNMSNIVSSQPGIYYHIISIAEAKSWYHRQFVNEDESILFELRGDSIMNFKKSFDVKVDDKLNVYMVNKIYNLNGYCHTRSHIMICNNFDIFDDFSNLKKNNLILTDLFNIEKVRNKEKTQMIYRINTNEDNNIERELLIFNMLNYEINIYKYLSSLPWISDDFTDITVYDLYENDKTINIISYIKEFNKKEFNKKEIDMANNICPESPVKKRKRNN